MSVQINTTPSGNKFYVIDNIKYDIHFPLHWAIDHKEDTGPIQCANCECYGKLNHVFVCYCANCYRVYEGKRGGKIICAEDAKEQELWEVLPYLDGLHKHQIGCVTYDDLAKFPTEPIRILAYRGNTYITLEEAINRLEELKDYETMYDDDDYYCNSRKGRLDYAEFLEEMVYLEAKIEAVRD